MKYFIAVQLEHYGPFADLTSSLQRAFDNGVAGDFQVLPTQADNYMVVFMRSTHEDAKYVGARADAPGVSIEQAAMLQLAGEFSESGDGRANSELVEKLLKGDAHCFDYALGAVESMAEYTHPTESIGKAKSAPEQTLVLPPGWVAKKLSGWLNPWRVLDANGVRTRYAGPTKKQAILNALPDVGIPA